MSPYVVVTISTSFLSIAEWNSIFMNIPQCVWLPSCWRLLELFPFGDHYIGLAKKLAWVFPYDVMERPQWHFWPIQYIQFSSVQFSPSVVSDSLQPHESQHASPPCPSPTPRAHSDSHPLSRWCHPAISSWVVPFSSCPQSLPASVFSNESTLRMRWPKV